MDNLSHSFDPIRFSEEEKAQLAARLKRAAEQEDNVKNTTKHTLRRTSRRLIVGVAVAATLTTGALAAAVGGGFLSYFETRTPEDQSALENSIYQLNRSETYNGWTVALTDCVGDDTNVYLWVEVTAPERTVLAPLNGGVIYTDLSMKLPEGVSAGYESMEEAIPDSDPQDNHIAFCLELSVYDGTLRGQSVDVTLDTIADHWWSDPGTDYAVQHEGDVTGAIMDHAWVFEDVVLDYPDQALRLEPDVEVPFLDGTATLTQIEITPLTTTVRIEGGSCYDHHDRGTAQQPDRSEDTGIDAGSVTMTGGPEEDISAWFECWEALETTLVMKDGTRVETPETGLGGSTCEDGIGGAQEVPYVEKRFQYAENSNVVAPRVIDPSQVDYVMVCGVRIDLPET